MQQIKITAGKGKANSRQYNNNTARRIRTIRNYLEDYLRHILTFLHKMTDTINSYEYFSFLPDLSS